MWKTVYAMHRAARSWPVRPAACRWLGAMCSPSTPALRLPGPSVGVGDAVPVAAAAPASAVALAGFGTAPRLPGVAGPSVASVTQCGRQGHPLLLQVARRARVERHEAVVAPVLQACLAGRGVDLREALRVLQHEAGDLVGKAVGQVLVGDGEVPHGDGVLVLVMACVGAAGDDQR